jgi:uncharacterized protein (DUF362 family)/Pyruvate/2-oxoacid:ferredoxin oxidoreductase delta subunit
VRRGIDLIGGISSILKNGKEVLLKPNLLAGDPPEKAVTTHPAVFKAVAEIFKEAGARLYYGDSPGVSKPGRAAGKAGIKAVADELGIRHADFQTPVKVSYPNALLAKQLNLAAGVVKGRNLISISKMKTHGLTRITGAVKNQFGCIPGFLKAEYHVKMPDTHKFSTVLVDINNYLKPGLFIMDGITAMEGNGPRGGEPIDMKVLLFSTDPAALDSIFCKLIDLDPEFVPYLVIAQQAKLGTYKYETIDTVGDDVDGLINKNFKAVRKPANRLPTPFYFPTFLKNLISPRPVIHYDSCTKCGTCVLQCPVTPKAADWSVEVQGRRPRINYKRCIRCYCCQEICPYKAISIKVPFLGKIIYRN